jgi:DNA-binding CsgD family transcriptional regulator/tetratricopeptide (TPR) repeat protein
MYDPETELTERQSSGVCAVDAMDHRKLTALTPIRGRSAELKIVGELIAATAARRGGVLVIEGPPGIGKSRLLTEVITEAERAGVRYLFGEAFEYQQAVPFFPLFMATLGADPPVGDAEGLRRLGGSADLRYWVVHDLQAAIHRAAAQTPLAIVLEDIHWADTATLVALRSLTAPSDVPVLWVLTTRTGAGGSAVRETLRVLERAGAAVVRLPAMTADAMADVVEDVVRARADESLLTLAAKSHGNPFLLTELLGGLREEGRLEVTDGQVAASGGRLPRRLRANMQQRLDGLSEEAGEVVRVAAVLPDRFSAALLAEMLDRRPAALVSAVGESVRADLLSEDGEHLRFRHDLLREATRQTLPRSLRRAMERQTASVMLEMGAAPEEVATQLARSAEVGDFVAIAALREAAQSVARSDVSAAADLSRRALELVPLDDPDRGHLVAQTVELLNRAARYQEAQGLAATALSAAVSPAEEAEIRLRLWPTTTGSTERRIEENRRALGSADINGVTRVRHQAWLAFNLVMTGDHDDSRVAVQEAAAAAETDGDLESRILCATAQARLACADGHGLRAVACMEEVHELIRGGENTPAHWLAEIHRANLLAMVDRLDEAGVQIARGIELAHRERNGMALEHWGSLDAIVHLAAGRLAEARTAAIALPTVDDAAGASAGLTRMVILAQLAVHTEDRTLLQETVIEARAACVDDSPVIRRRAATVLAMAAWQRGDVHEALRWLGTEAILLILITPIALDQLTLAARVASAAGDAGLLARTSKDADLLDRERPGVSLFHGVAQHVHGILQKDPDAILAATSALKSSSRPLLYAAAAEDAGIELSRVHRMPEALDELNAAFDAYAGLGAVGDARRVARVLRPLGVERRVVMRPREKSGWGSLTDSELKVADLIAAGATNRNVAEQLQLSPHTVSTHLRNAFAKLGINSRHELTQLVRRSQR